MTDSTRTTLQIHKIRFTGPARAGRTAQPSSQRQVSRSLWTGTSVGNAMSSSAAFTKANSSARSSPAAPVE